MSYGLIFMVLLMCSCGYAMEYASGDRILSEQECKFLEGYLKEYDYKLTKKVKKLDERVEELKIEEQCLQAKNAQQREANLKLERDVEILRFFLRKE